MRLPGLEALRRCAGASSLLATVAARAWRVWRCKPSVRVRRCSRRRSQAAYRLKRMRLKSEQAELDTLIREAEQTSDSETVRALLTRKMSLLAQRRVIDEASQLQG